MFFLKLVIEEMVKTNFNQEVLVAMYESAESGISPLMVIPRTKQEIKVNIWQEEADAKYWGKQTQSEALHMNKDDPRRPPRNWYELKKIMATFDALLWVLFGYVCPLYD